MGGEIGILLGLMGLIVQIVGKVGFYSIPDPTVIVCRNRLKVSIPDSDGIELFTFRGVIKNTKDESRDISYIVMYKDEAGLWSYENNGITLNMNDVISFWLLVNKHGKGYYRFGFSYIISEWSEECEFDFSKRASNHNFYKERSKPVDIYPNLITNSIQISHIPQNHLDCASESQLKEIKSSIKQITAELKTITVTSKQVREDFQNFSELSLTFIDKDKFGTKILLKGSEIATPGQLSDFLKKYLLLEKINVISVDHIHAGLVFQVSSITEKIQVLSSRNKLKNTGFTIEHYAEPIIGSTTAPTTTTSTEKAIDFDVRFGE